jgi:hypothetical protein
MEKEMIMIVNKRFGKGMSIPKDLFQQCLQFLVFYKDNRETVRTPESLESALMLIQDYFHCSPEEAKEIDPALNFIVDVLNQMKDE